MKAMRFHEYGDPSVLRLEDVKRPVPGPGQVRIRVAATSFNGVDANIRAGYMRGPIPVALPHTPGSDVAGTVDALGEGVDRFAAGDAVIGFLGLVAVGASAEYVLAPAGILAPAPASIPLADAAALPVAGLTAWQALFDHAKLTAGQRVLINGAGGAVGAYAVQLAKGAGAYVIGVTGPRSADRARAAGADEVLDRDAGAVTEPVDAVLNLAPVTPDRLAALVPHIVDGGVLVNTTVWMPAPSDEARGVRGIDLFVRGDAAQLAGLAARVDAGELTVDVARRVPLAGLATVHAEPGAVSGKTVITV
ncbi:NADP-dependent oxidoreductase [Catenuloplanes indicus]|uniref:NADPH:quinone reductase-like Zn-dependent oxidoreductase n=1 Tax=Catenuloplanes indicus TaxID=137267 RepID=A0AAE3VVL9_9ACTN|nr:NADP-dependent oxidoreductase [Catenuloplanes indicus]MDQ0363790.1 NADPH:quinone reductase-like Zn-dependent oxidoreductase [Catenuloplanes indicus]